MDMRYLAVWIFLSLVLPVAGSAWGIDYVLVRKSEGKMFLLADKQVLREYNIALGANPKGHKQREGDERTPEGAYILDYKKSDSGFYKAIHIDYPNAADRARARAAKVDPGGQIMIHGQKNGYGRFARVTQRFNWTDGCIAVTNAEMDELWRLVEVGTPIVIRP
ncbi:MAG: L,D-transpeptidase family protein [Syntrophotaleaceae bacterium]